MYTTKKIIPLQLITFCLVTHTLSLFAQSKLAIDKNIKEKPFSFPVQMEMRVPFTPTAFQNGSKSYLLYELYLTNFSNSDIHLQAIKLLNEKMVTAKEVALFDSAQLVNMVQTFGESSAFANKLIIKGGQCVIVFMEIAIDRKNALSDKLLHRLITQNDSLDGAVINTHNTTLQTLVPPVKGTNWLAADAPSNDADNHHRRGVVILNGTAINSRRFAIDWKKARNGVSFSGNSRDVQAYLCYGQPVYAVANGRVVKAVDGLPNNIPGHGAQFHPAIPLTFERLAGNTIVIDLGNGHYAHYMHLQPGSLLVKKGDIVHKGDFLAKIGASGDAREPHLHFEITTSLNLLLGEGLPYLIEQFWLHKPNGELTELRTRELPTDEQIVDFKR
ncbi:M23 family metallopeptidase [Mucilaginibacter sp. 44-25]|uniref:M23 family metallopeptidase n=1 Tax=Mucilaginibacter sp. 44-25 TaxID=1895794 RepID=UPI00095C9C05|nr:M23 family metallopeptidase [Mucilaginibacter sp. 44-25]OJW18161.1 MAG: hypothetical protein BGO48_16470 [Mucilaginibacter sp. 44-25]